MNEVTHSNLQELADFYWGTYYKNVTNAVIISKGQHTPILIEESNALSHLSTIWRDATPPITDKKKLENVGLAQNHLKRAWLDCHKIIWQVLLTDFKFAVTDRFRANSFCKAGFEIVPFYQECIEDSIAAREHELKNVGLGVDTTIAKYSELWDKMRGLLFNMNNGDLISSEMTRIKSKACILSASIAGGFIASLLLSMIAKLFG